MFDEEELLPISALEHLIYCERQAALIHIERLWDANVATVEGTYLHNRAHDDGTDARGDVRTARGLMLHSLRLGLSGKTDIVEFHLLPGSSDSGSGVVLPGAAGRWQPYPVEYKRGRRRHERSFQVQVCAQALCLEEMLGVSVPAGALFFGKTARRQEVAFDDTLRRETEHAAQRMHELFRLRLTPKAEYSRKCEECSMRGLCLPGVMGPTRSARAWLEEAAGAGDSR